MKAQLHVEYWNHPEIRKGEKNPFATNNLGERHNSYITSAKINISEELLPDLIEFLEENGVFMGRVRGMQVED